MFYKAFVENKEEIADIMYSDLLKFLQNNRGEIVSDIKQKITFDVMPASSSKCINVIIDKIIKRYDKEAEVVFLDKE